MTAAAWLRHSRQALPWCGLAWLSLAGAQLVQVVAASLLAPAPPPGGPSNEVIVLLTLRDPSTGRDTEFLCRTTRDRLGVDALVIDVDAAREVSQGLCDSISLAAPALSDG